jgi:hypothetical protein
LTAIIRFLTDGTRNLDRSGEALALLGTRDLPYIARRNDMLLFVTSKDVLLEIDRLVRKEAKGEMTNATFIEEVDEIILGARVSLTDDEFRDVLQNVLRMHHLLAADLSKHGCGIPGNDPLKPN